MGNQGTATMGSTTKGNRQCVPNKERRGIKPWMTEHILQLMEERRKWKEPNRGKYLELDRKVNSKC